MATATQKELLHDSKNVDTVARDRMNRLALAVKDAADEMDESVEPTAIEDLQLDEPDSDPFNGNLNNRRVAARIARGIEVSAGDPKKAKADVEQSLRVNPEPVIKTGDEFPEIKLVGGREVTPGSPADLKHGKSQTQMGGQAPTGEQAQQASTAPAATETKGKGKNPPQWKHA